MKSSSIDTEQFGAAKIGIWYTHTYIQQFIIIIKIRLLNLKSSLKLIEKGDFQPKFGRSDYEKWKYFFLQYLKIEQKWEIANWYSFHFNIYVNVSFSILLSKKIIKRKTKMKSIL